MSLPYPIPLLQRVSISAVHQASKIASKVQYAIVQDDAVTKVDKSPVTIADYTCQLLITVLIQKHFPDIPIIGEESSDSLKSETKTLSQVVSLFNEGLKAEKEDPELWDGLEKEISEAEVLELLDRGAGEGGREGIFWALDPIDGTKGFLRHGQYAVCLGLISLGNPILGVIGCPNLPVDFHHPSTSKKGVIFVASKGGSSWQRSLTSTELTKIGFRFLPDTTHASFCESVEAGHSDQTTNAKIASILGITKPSVRMDSQAKYCSIARGDGDIYLRLPVSKTYEEKIWDHAAGNILIHEAGGVVTDIHGKELDFGLGRTLRENKGVVACRNEWGEQVLAAVKKALEEGV